MDDRPHSNMKDFRALRRAVYPFSVGLLRLPLDDHCPLRGGWEWEVKSNKGCGIYIGGQALSGFFL